MKERRERERERMNEREERERERMNEKREDKKEWVNYKKLVWNYSDPFTDPGPITIV